MPLALVLDDGYDAKLTVCVQTAAGVASAMYAFETIPTCPPVMRRNISKMVSTYEAPSARGRSQTHHADFGVTKSLSRRAALRIDNDE